LPRLGLIWACCLTAILLPLEAQAGCAAAPFLVRGHSLAPLIENGETVEGYVGDCGDPARGGLILFTHLGAKIPLLKIVVGVPGDRFGVRPDGDRWNIMINSAAATNGEGVPYRLNKARADRIGLYAKGAGGVIPPNSWLAMGDDPAGSDDSSRFGLITRDALRGKAVALKTHPH